MALRRNAPDKVKLKLRGDGRPLGELGNDLLPQAERRPDTPGALIRDENGRALLDWSGGDAAALFRHPDPAVTADLARAAAGRLLDLDRTAHSRLSALTERLADGLASLPGDRPPQVRSEPGLLFLSLPSGGEDHLQFREAMLARGIWLPVSREQPWLVTLAHDEAAVDRTVMAVTDVLGAGG